MNYIKNVFLLLNCLLIIISCSKSETGPVSNDNTPPVVETEENIVLEISKAEIIADSIDFVTFTIKLGDKNITSESIIFMEGASVPENGNIFKAAKEGTYRFYAKYKDKKSNEVTIRAIQPKQKILPEDPHPDNFSFHRNVMALQFTGIGCINCPAVYEAIKGLQENYKDIANKVIFVSVHSYEKGGDPMYSTLTNELAGVHGVTYAPDLRCDFRALQNKYDIKSVAGIKQMIEYYHSLVTAKVGISASVVLEKLNNIKITIAAKAAVAGKYRYGIFVLEDGIYAQQKGTNNTEYYTHNNVVRHVYGRRSASDFSGDNLELEAKETKLIEKTIVLKEEWKADKCKVLIYITDSESGYKVNNATVCKVNDMVEFAYNK